MAKRGHDLALDGVRGLAIAAVMLTHGAGVFVPSPANDWLLKWFRYGWMGVDLFFVLSGFLITGILLDTAEAGNRARSFYARRILRIFPIYYLTLFGCMLLISISRSARAGAPLQGWKDYLAYLLYFQNWLPLWHGGNLPGSYLGHFWSLGVEEQFYFVWPCVVWWLRCPSKVVRIAVGGATGMLILRIILMRLFGPGVWYLCLTVTRGDGLLLGAALAGWTKQKKRISPLAVASAFSVGMGFLVWMSLTNDRQLSDITAGRWLGTFGFSAIALLFAAAVASTRIGLLRPIWEAKPLTILGKYSYGLYVYHLPLWFFVSVVFWRWMRIGPPFRTRYAVPYLAFLILADIAVAWLSYRFIESRFLRLKRYFEPSVSDNVLQPYPTGTEVTPVR